MDRQLKQVGRLELGALSANIVIDPQGRQCVEMPIGDGVYCFTITQALMFREMLDLALATLGRFVREPAEAASVAITEDPEGAP